jgi:broad specificity phosphatase PhoE
MTTRIVLVCHARTAAMRDGAFPADEPIDEAGAARAAGLSGQLHPGGRAWTSPALRARQTALALGLDAAIAPALRDCDYGRWSGRRLAEIEAEEPAALAAWLAEPATAAHGGEAGSALLERVAAWLDERGREAGRVIAVTHAAVIRAAIVRVIRATPRSFGHIDVAPLSLTLLTCHAGYWRLRSTGQRLRLRPGLSTKGG